MRTFEIIPIREDNFVQTSLGISLIRSHLEVKAETLEIENGIAIFYIKDKIVHTTPVSKVIIKSE